MPPPTAQEVKYMNRANELQLDMEQYKCHSDDDYHYSLCIFGDPFMVMRIPYRIRVDDDEDDVTQ